jgi:hypothetical protein
VPAVPLLLASALVAATPLASDGFVPFVPPGGGSGPVFDQATGTAIEPVETFDPVARAELLARELPRQWSGSYQAFAAGAPLPVTLNLTAVRAMGAIVDLRGEISIDGVVSPVQGNLSAESDQLDLIPLGDQLGGGLQPGGEFQGLQGLELSGWNANRLTEQGGRLALRPAAITAPAASGSGAAGAALPIRGLW